MNTRKLKNIKSLILGLSLLGGTAFAQQNHSPKGDLFQKNQKFKLENLEHLKKHFNLSEKQSEDLRRLFEKSKEEWQKDRKTFMEKVEKHKDSIKKEFKKTLTPEQLKKWEKEIGNFRLHSSPRIDHFFPKDKNKGHWEHLKKELNLSEEQINEIKNFVKEQQDSFKNKMQNTLTPEQFKQWEERLKNNHTKRKVNYR